MWGELEIQQLLAQLFWLNGEVPEAAVGLPAYEDYFAKLADFGSYLQGGYYAFGLGLRQELIRQMLG